MPPTWTPGPETSRSNPTKTPGAPGPATNMTKLTLWVPSRFWDDHAERCPSDDGEAGLCTEVRSSGRRTQIEGTPAQVECLRSDAAFYCDRWGPDECPPGLKRSARATLDAIAKATS